MVISGNITNTDGNTTIKNFAAPGMDITADAQITTSGDRLYMFNSGEGGMQINGTFNNTGNATVTNKRGALNLGGSFVN